MAEDDKKYFSPMSCWDMYSVYFDKLVHKARSDYDLKQLEINLKTTLDTRVIEAIAEESYDALVVTDPFQRIVWVSRGFTNMTGYSKAHAIGKQPKFLQGPETSERTKQRIREELLKRNYFTDHILNYKKTGEAYLCQIKIVPLFDAANKFTHYLAVEREVDAA